MRQDRTLPATANGRRDLSRTVGLIDEVLVQVRGAFGGVAEAAPFLAEWPRSVPAAS